jgi:hypothetical protein
MMSKNLAVLHSLGDSGILLDFGIGRNPQEPYQPVIKGDGEEEVEGGASGCCNGFDGLGNLDSRSVAWTMSLGHLDNGLDVDVAYRGVLLRISYIAWRPVMGGPEGKASQTVRPVMVAENGKRGRNDWGSVVRPLWERRAEGRLSCHRVIVIWLGSGRDGDRKGSRDR